MLAGLIVPDSGRVTLDDTVLDDDASGVHVPPERRTVGVVFQDNLLFPHLSIEENVAFGLRSRGTSRTEARRVARAWLDTMGLADRLLGTGRLPSGWPGATGSDGARTGPAPRLLLLDEPLAALDVRAAGPA